MKTIITNLLMIAPLMALVLLSTPLLSQVIQEAPEDKAVVYFVRTGSFANSAVSADVYCENGPIGRLLWKHFLIYECEPGSQLFGVLLGAYKQFVDAELLAGRIYLIEIRSLFAGVRMEPVNPIEDIDRLDRIRTLVNNKQSIKAYTKFAKKNFHKNKITKSQIEYGMKWYPAYVEMGDVKQLQSDWFVEPEELSEPDDLGHIK
jgi:hypothetical protein